MNIDIRKLVVSRLENRPSEDVVGAFELNGFPVIVLCDGAGGYGDGRGAAEECIKLVKSHMLDHVDSVSYSNLSYDAIMYACNIISDKGMGETTVVIAIVTDESIYITGSGDSHAYLIKDGKDVHLTDRFVKQRVGAGCFPISRVIENTGGQLIIGSDGLWNYCPVDAVKAEFEKPQTLEEKIKRCFRIATRTGMFDDFSIVVLNL